MHVADITPTHAMSRRCCCPNSVTVMRGAGDDTCHISTGGRATCHIRGSIHNRPRSPYTACRHKHGPIQPCADNPNASHLRAERTRRLCHVSRLTCVPPLHTCDGCTEKWERMLHRGLPTRKFEKAGKMLAAREVQRIAC